MTPQLTNLTRRGFTLIELLVVMSILVILLAAAVPVFSYITAARSAESGQNMAAAMLGRARTLALNRDDGKYVGVLFYSQGDEGRDVMQLVEVEPEPVDLQNSRYASWDPATVYYGPSSDPAAPPTPDVVYSVTRDNEIGGTGSPLNGRPVVKRYVALQGAFPSPSNTGQLPTPSGSGPAFADAFWDVSSVGNTIPIALDAEVQYLPRGVRANVIKRATSDTFATPGIVLFDKQGRLALKRWGIVNDSDPSIDGGEKLLEAMGQPETSPGKFTELPVGGDSRTSGIGIAVYSEADLNVDKKDTAKVATWVKDNATQLTVGQQSGELVQP